MSVDKLIGLAEKADGMGLYLERASKSTKAYRSHDKVYMGKTYARRDSDTWAVQLSPQQFDEYARRDCRDAQYMGRVKGEEGLLFYLNLYGG